METLPVQKEVLRKLKSMRYRISLIQSISIIKKEGMEYGIQHEI